MVKYLNPLGHNWGPENLDGYGISYIVIAVAYSIFFYAACFYLWLQRNHPVVRMRKINLALLSILILHVYLFMALIVYPLNGAFPCGVEFWSMSMYLPIGIGLFQAQNQQLLIVSREQNMLVHRHEMWKELPGSRAGGIGGPRYWMYRFKIWWQRSSQQGKYEAFVFVGIVIQFLVSLILYTISRKFNAYGVVSHATTPGLCRRGWEWLPSIFWQFLWNYFFGPYLIWKIRMINDIYHWRLQTILAIVAGIPGTPLWLAGVYSDSFASVNKYWAPCMWFVPGLITMELTTILFPLYHIRKHTSAVGETARALADFDKKQFGIDGNDDTTMASIATPSTGSKRGKMYSMETLDECLNSSFDGLQVYASCMELNGENIVFLTKVLNFNKEWYAKFSRTDDLRRTRMTMFRAALSIYVSLIDSHTASYPINIESPIYQKLESIFGAATSLVACRRRGSTVSSVSQVTPWDEPEDPMAKAVETIDSEGFDLQEMRAAPATRISKSNDSREQILSIDDQLDPHDPLVLANFKVPAGFDENVFEPAFRSIRYMVWSETWQRYQTWKRTSGTAV